MEKSQEINEFAKAMALAQGEIENATKNANNTGFRSKYADLAEVLNTCRPVLAKNGIAIIQGPGKFTDSTLEVTTLLVHTSGQWVSETLVIPVAPKASKSTGGLAYDPQSAGSAITYARRYSLAAMVGIAQEDDDGNSSSILPKKPNTTPPDDFPPPEAFAPEPQAITSPPQRKNQEDDHCANCGNWITPKVKAYAMERYRMPLCMACQKNAPK